MPNMAATNLADQKANPFGIVRGARHLLAGLISVSLLLACATTAFAQIDLTVSKPSTLEGLLRNIRIALERGILLENDFYKVEALRQYFGGAEVRLSRQAADGDVVGSVSAFGNFVEPLIVSGQPVPGFSLSLRCQLDGVGKTASLLLNVPGKTLVNFGTVEAIFGQGWSTPAVDPSPHRILRVPSHPQGDAQILYSGRVGSRYWRARFDFKSNAELSFAAFSMSGAQ